MGRAITAKKIVDKNAALETAKAAKEATDKVKEELEYLQTKLVAHMSKKNWNIEKNFIYHLIHIFLLFTIDFKWITPWPHPPWAPFEGGKKVLYFCILYFFLIMPFFSFQADLQCGNPEVGKIYISLENLVLLNKLVSNSY